MKQFPRLFEWRLTRRVTREIKKSKELRAEYQEYRRQLWQRSDSSALRYFWLAFLMIPGVIAAIVLAQGPLDEMMVVLGLFAVLMTGFVTFAARTGEWSASGSGYVLSFFPVADRDIAKVKWREALYLRIMLLCIMGSAYCIIGVKQNFAPEQWLITAFVFVLNWGLLGWCVMLCVHRFPRFPMGGLTLLSALLLICCFVVPDLRELLARGIYLFYAIPINWGTALFVIGAVDAQPVATQFFGPAAFAFVLYYRLLGKWQRAYSTTDMVASDTSAEMEYAEAMQEYAEMLGDAPLTATESSRATPRVGEAVQLDRYLSDRERMLLDFMTGDLYGYTGGFRFACGLAIVGALLPFVKVPFGLAVAVVGLAFLIMLPVLGGGWLGLDDQPTGTLIYRTWCLYPITYMELTWLLFKANLLRIARSLPIVLLVSVVMGFHVKAPGGGLLAIPALVFLAALQPGCIAFRVTYPTFSMNAFDVRSLCAVVVVVAMLIGVGVAGWVFFNFTPVNAATGLLLTATLSLAVWAAIGHLYNSSTMDLLYHNSQ